MLRESTNVLVSLVIRYGGTSAQEMMKVESLSQSQVVSRENDEPGTERLLKCGDRLFVTFKGFLNGES